MSDRWTVRNVDPDSLALLREVHVQRGVAMGVLLSRAIRVWHASLTEAAERREPREIGPIISCDVGYPASLTDLLQQFWPGS